MQQVASLQSILRGPVVVPGSPEYDETRKLYNAMIDKKPAVIARCKDAADVISAIKFGHENSLTVAVRGGGHNGGGLGSVDNGLMIDLSLMRGVRVDPETRTAQVAGGAQFGDVDHATHAFGLAVPAGIISTTGVGGLTLGGGVGHLTRKYGLTIDNLLSADIVLADGSFVTASADKNKDLFWAVRGGGGNFGVVTSFTFRLHPVSTVVAGPTFWPMEDAAEVLKFYREFIGKAPEELNGFFAFLTVPNGPPFPEELRLKKVAGVVWCYLGSPQDAETLLASLPQGREDGNVRTSTHAIPHVAKPVRWDLSTRASVVLASRLCQGNQQQGSGTSRQEREQTSDARFDDAPLPDRRGSFTRLQQRHSVGLQRRKMGRGDGWCRP